MSYDYERTAEPWCPEPPPEAHWCSDCGAAWDDARSRCSECELTIEDIAERIADARSERST